MTGDFWDCERYDREARRLYEAGDYDGSAELLEEGLARYPGAPELHVSLGYAHLGREVYAWAAGAFRTALGLSPDHEEALAGLGETWLKLGERARAFLAFERIVELGFDDDAELMLAVGRALAREKLWVRAERFLRLALRADRSCADAAFELALLRRARDDRRSAVRWLRRALRSDGGHHEARAAYGNLLYERGDEVRALAELERIPPRHLFDPVAAWRVVELMRRLRGTGPEAPELAPWLERLEALSVEPTPEDRLLAEVAGVASVPVANPGQLDLFTVPPEGREERLVHRVRGPQGCVYEGDWATIVLAMRDRSPDPSMSVAEFMRHEARRLRDLTGVPIPDDDPRRFIVESARAGVFRIER